MEIWKEVERDEVSCVDPLTVAVNDRGKKRVCIDLSRYVNDFVSAAKFRIESTLQFLQVVKIETGREHWGFLGLVLKIDGVKRFFVFTCLPFRLNDATCALTKLLRFPLQRGGSGGIRPSFILMTGSERCRARS